MAIVSASLSSSSLTYGGSQYLEWQGADRLRGDPTEVMRRVYQIGDIFSLSERSVLSKIPKGEFLGIEKIDGQYLIHSEPYQLLGPIPDVPQRVNLLPGTTDFSIEVAKGSVVSSLIRVCSLRLHDENNKPLLHPYIVVQAMTGYSGVFINLTCYS